MTHTNLFDRSLGELARNIAGATAVFHEHDLDFCCAGSQSLREALGDSPLEMEWVAQRLAALEARPTPPQTTNWRLATPQQLIDHIVSQYHDGHRRQLPELVGLARKVEATHANHPLCPTGLAGLLVELGEGLEPHMQKEEELLFPLLRAGVNPLTLASVSELKADHSTQGEVLKRVLAAAHQLEMREDACNTWRALREGLTSFKHDLMQHIHIENNILFEGLSQRGEPNACAGTRCGCAAP